LRRRAYEASPVLTYKRLFFKDTKLSFTSSRPLEQDLCYMLGATHSLKLVVHGLLAAERFLLFSSTVLPALLKEFKIFEGLALVL